MRTISNVYLFVCMVVLCSCQPKSIEIDIPTPEQQMVVASHIIPSKIMIIGLTKSFSALESDSKKDTMSQDFLNKILVDSAFVTISYLNKTDTLFRVSPGIYASLNTLLNDNGVYTLRAKDLRTNKEIIATTTLLPQVVFDTIVPRLNVSGKDTIVHITYEFSDMPGIENYYVINYYVKTDSVKGGQFDLNQFFGKGSNKLLTAFELFSDKEMPNGKMTVDLPLLEVKTSDSLVVTLSNISKGYYEFLTAFRKSGDPINLITGEPINYPSNVNNGYGYFNAYYPDVHFFDLKKYK